VEKVDTEKVKLFRLVTVENLYKKLNQNTLVKGVKKGSGNLEPHALVALRGTVEKKKGVVGGTEVGFDVFPGKKDPSEKKWVPWKPTKTKG